MKQHLDRKSTDSILLLFQDEINLDEDEDEASDTEKVESKEQDKTFDKPERKTSEDTDKGSREEITVKEDDYETERNFQIPKTEISHDEEEDEAGLSEMDQVIPRKLHPLLELVFDLFHLFIIIPARGQSFLIISLLK